ncbi:MAG: hypothetical protein ACFWT8_14120 [Lacticaseibacillus casei]
MKKTLLLLPAVLLLFATGCGQNSQSSSKSDSVRTSQSKKQAKNHQRAASEAAQLPKQTMHLASSSVAHRPPQLTGLRMQLSSGTRP